MNETSASSTIDVVSPSPSPSPSRCSSEAVDITSEMPARLVLFSHEFPSGDIQDLFRRLHRFSKLRRFPLLARFLEECTAVLQQEIQNLPRHLRGFVPPFHDMTTLVSHFAELSKSFVGSTLEGALLCVYEIAMLIGHYEAHGLKYDLVSPETCFAGVSIGLFAAAAAAVSSSAVELISCGAESVRVAFAFCIHVARVSQQLEARAPDETPPSWASVVTDLSADAVQAELDDYNGANAATAAVSPLARVSISHSDQSSVGITGPPSRLADLFRQSQVLGSSRHSSLPISGGLCHVSNVYDDEDASAILGAAADVWTRWHSRRVRVPLLSPHTGLAFPAEDAVQLLQQICSEALTKSLFFDKLTEGVVSRLSASGVLRCQVLHYRTSLISDSLLATVTDKLSSAVISSGDLVEWSQTEELEEAPLRSFRDAKLAIVGMACRMPGSADTPERFWDLLMAGRDTHTTIPSDRFDLQTHFDPTGKTENATDIPFGNFIDSPGLFDAGFFNMSPREANQTDPMQRLALVTAYEALEMAGFVPNRTPSTQLKRVGTFYGQASDDYREVNASQKVSTYGIPGTERAFGNGRINYFFKFGGPSFNLDTACSSGLAAVQAACSALWAGEADTVVTGGLNVITNPDIYCMLTKGHFLSKTGQCKVWDQGADGYCRADGIGSVVIKRLEDAVADNDAILATIVAGATNHSAESISITHPHAGTQMENYRQVMLAAGVSPLEVSYVELHGTGTQAGDAVESESVTHVFAPAHQRGRPEQRLHLGAVKSNIGHGEAAAGIASLIKVLLMYRNNMIPRHIGIRTTINPVVARHLNRRNAGVVFEHTPWHRIDDKKRYAIVNSFGAHGGNTTLLLEDAPSATSGSSGNVADDPRPWNRHIICVSAKSKVSLRGNIEALLRYLDTNPNADLADLAYTTCARRMHHPLRVAATVADVSQLRGFLQATTEDQTSWTPVSTTAPRAVVFAFSGQGSFYDGAGAQLFARMPYFRDQVRLLDRMVCRLGFPSVLEAIAGTNVTKGKELGTAVVSSGVSTETLTRDPLVTQLAIVVLEIALARFWELLGITPNVVVGHSLGEYAALVAAGVLSAADAIYLVGKRAELLLGACKPGTHAMLSVRASAARIAELASGRSLEAQHEVSCVNGRNDTVVSGTRRDMHTLRDAFEDEGLKCRMIDVPFAFHSAQLDPILADFESLAQRVTFRDPTAPIISPLLGRCVFDGKVVCAEYVCRASREPVDFVAALDAALEPGTGLIDDRAVWVEIGPHPVCVSFARTHTPGTQTFASLRQGEGDLDTLAGSLAGLHCLGLPVAWNEYFKPYEKAHRLLHLERYQWDEKNHWIQYEGNWTLDKAHPNRSKDNAGFTPATKPFLTSSVQQILSEDIGERTAAVAAVSSVAHPDFLGAVNGHRINGRGVVTGSIWADMALTIGEHLYKRLMPGVKEVFMNVSNMEVFESQLVQEDATTHQLILVEGAIELSQSRQDQLHAKTHIRWYEARPDGSRRSDKHFASVTVLYEDAQLWQDEWKSAAHLVSSRASSLRQMATCAESDRFNVDVHPSSNSTNNRTNTGTSLLSQAVVYSLFGNVVDYAPRYRGMKSVILSPGLEATAEIALDADTHGRWHTPPHWIDGAFQLAGFVMNAFGDDAANASARDFFYITPGWGSLRMLPGALAPEQRLRSYVRMLAVGGDEPSTWEGDIYLLRGENVVGVCKQIRFKRVPRALMSLMFPRRGGTTSAGRDRGNNNNTIKKGEEKRVSPVMRTPPVLATSTTSGGRSAKDDPSAFSATKVNYADSLLPRTAAKPLLDHTASSFSSDMSWAVQQEAAKPVVGNKARLETMQGENDTGENSITSSCLQIIATETGLDVGDLSDEAAFSELGVDSLMSLVLTEKFQAELGIGVRSSIFLEYPTVREFLDWLAQQ